MLCFQTSGLENDLIYPCFLLVAFLPPIFPHSGRIHYDCKSPLLCKLDKKTQLNYIMTVGDNDAGSRV